jgi:hypothetical protein
MDSGDRRALGASTVLVLGGVVLTTLGFWPDGNAAEGWVPGRTWAAPEAGGAAAASRRSGPSSGPDAAAAPTTLVMPDGSVVDVLPSSTPAGRAKPPKPTPGYSNGPGSGPTAGPSAGPTAWPTTRPSSNPTSRPTAAPTPSPHPTPTPTPPPIGSCSLFPSSNVWNQRVDNLPVASNSATMIAGIGLTSYLHPDFSSTAYNGGLGYGIPFNKVNLSTTTYHVAFDYADESDPGPYPIPSSPMIESGSDRHLLLWDTQGCNLYEIYDAVKTSSGWTGGSGAIWDLTSNALRPNGWTSADAAGLPILPGLARYEEVAAGAILHALRFTAPKTCANHIYPARHDAGSYSCSGYPPMGLRVRLKGSVEISGFGPQARVILTALKRYGMLLADNGSPWYVTGAPNASWNDDDLHALQTLHGADFEVVDTSTLR